MNGGEGSGGPEGSEKSPLGGSGMLKGLGIESSGESRLQGDIALLTSKASLRLWVREPRASHWSQIFWHRVLTLWES